MTSALLSARSLHKSFGGVRAVRDVSFDIPSGAVFAIIGPNGAGKSTMLNLIGGVYQPDSGSMSFGGNDLAGLPSHRRVRLGIARTFQKIRLFKQLSVLDNVVAGFHIHHNIPAWQYLIHGSAFRRDHAHSRLEAMELLAFVGLAGRSGTLAGSLSYGEQRLLECVQKNRGRSAAGLRDRIDEALTRFVGRAKAVDDLTIVILKRKSLDE